MKIRIIKENYGSYSMGTKGAPSKEERQKSAEAVYKMFKSAKEDPAATLQFIAEVSGLIPGIGNIGDILAALIALYREKPVEAIFNFLAALPVIGLGARVASKAFLKISARMGLTPVQALTKPEAWKAAWQTAGPTFQRAFGSNWVSRIQGQKILKDMDMAREELNKILKNTEYSATLSGFINDHFLKLDVLFQAAIAGLYLAFGDDLKTMTGEDFVSADQAYCAEFPQFCKDEATASERPPPRQQYIKVMP